MSFLRYIVTITLMLLLSSCFSTYRSIGYTYKSSGPYYLNVVDINIIKKDKSIDEYPYVSSQVKIQPVDFLHKHLSKLFVTSGLEGRALITIEEASISETKFIQNKKKYFNNNKYKPYIGKFLIKIDILDRNGISKKFIKAKSIRNHYVPKNISSNELQIAWNDMLNLMMADLDKELKKNINSLTN